MKPSELKKSFFAALHSRMFVSLWILLFLQALALILIILTHPHGSLTVQAHCDVVGSVPVCNFAEVSWSYIFYFAGFAVLLFLLDALISLRLLDTKGRHFAIVYLWIAVVVMAIVTALIIGILHTIGY